VSLVYDDLVQENPILKRFPAFDLTPIEVLASPQGTLFGCNTAADVVKLHSVKPGKKFERYGSVCDGNDGTDGTDGTDGSVNLEGAANLPWSSDWSARISVQIQHRNDCVKNLTATAPT
jgi:iron complex outermembrane receptor protein